MAAQRVGVVNELAEDAGVSHKCLIEMHGKKLVEHVLACLDASPEVAHITVCIDDVSVLGEVVGFQALAKTGKARAVEAGSNLFSSFLAAIETDDAFPALVTTADNVLLTPDMVKHFCEDAVSSGCGAAVALTPKETLLAVYPDGQRRFHKFADGEYSNCNLYAVMDRSFINTGKVFERGGQFAKSPMRVIIAFGIINALAYRFAVHSLDGAMRRLSKRVRAEVRAIRMPFPEAPIDVDNFRSKALAIEILQARDEV